MLEYFGNMPYMLFQAQGFPSYELSNEYDNEEVEWKIFAPIIPLSYIPDVVNIISIHVIYKIKIQYYSSLKHKSHIAPHVNKDRFNNELRSDCSKGYPVEIRVVLSA